MSVVTFETITTPLTDEDKAVAMKLLEQIQGLTRPRNTNELVVYFNLVKKIILTPPKIRAMIHYLRTEHKAPIIGTSKGYHMAKSQTEIEQQIKSLEQRARSIQFVADALKKITILTN
jgi:hypothetical protein